MVLLKLGQRISEIVGRELKILNAFKIHREKQENNEDSEEEDLVKEEEYWDFRQAKKSISHHCE